MLIRKGSQNPSAKLADANIPDIRHRLSAGESGSSIARTFGVDPDTIGKIKRGETWRHI